MDKKTKWLLITAVIAVVINVLVYLFVGGYNPFIRGTWGLILGLAGLFYPPIALIFTVIYAGMVISERNIKKLTIAVVSFILILGTYYLSLPGLLIK